MGVAFKGMTAIAQRLIEGGADVNAANQSGQTALMMAALFGRGEIVSLLLAHGADPNVRDASGKTARDLVLDQGHAAMARLLETATE